MQNLQKIIPIIYFYLLSAVGMVLIIMGLFNTIHYIVGITAYEKYPLRYGEQFRCEYIGKPMPIEGQKDSRSEKEIKEDCLKNLEAQRINTKIDDLEKSVAFTIVGLLVFGSHFYFARRRSNP